MTAGMSALLKAVTWALSMAVKSAALTVDLMVYLRVANLAQRSVVWLGLLWAAQKV